MDLSSLTIGFIGYGNMAQAMAEGFVDQGVVTGGQIVACSGHFDKLEKTTSRIGARPLHSATEVAISADIVIIAVKPYVVESVIDSIKTEVAHDDKFIISIASGWTLEQYQSLFLPETHVICTIPNIPIAVGQGVVIAEGKDSLNDDQKLTVEAMFKPVALFERVETAQMSVGSVVAGCGPAYAAMFIEALADAGVKYGLPRQTAYRLAGKMVQGTGALQIATGQIPAAIKDAVCSPGGTTIKGVSALEQNGFRGSIFSAVDAVVGK
ncbi:MAG: pyrroline-5-carboxylate reductase [Bifidobacterium aquikefiri]|uniref:pyrroline-5-carboxylate reductase n=1 Tax=Bifidobacterium aquikefiri TaxID=1653207 RepID=UPI0039E9E714